MESIFLALTILAVTQPPGPTLNPGQVFAFDYLKDDLAKWSITRFERRIDNVKWETVPLSAGTEQPPSGEPPVILVTYTSVPPALTTGTHTLDVRACNASSCSQPLTLGFNAQLEPIPVINIRIQPVKPPSD